jgi:hypothetical protein
MMSGDHSKKEKKTSVDCMANTVWWIRIGVVKDVDRRDAGHDE